MSYGSLDTISDATSQVSIVACHTIMIMNENLLFPKRNSSPLQFSHCSSAQDIHMMKHVLYNIPHISTSQRDSSTTAWAHQSSCASSQQCCTLYAYNLCAIRRRTQRAHASPTQQCKVHLPSNRPSTRTFYTQLSDSSSAPEIRPRDVAPYPSKLRKLDDSVAQK